MEPQTLLGSANSRKVGEDLSPLQNVIAKPTSNSEFYKGMDADTRQFLSEELKSDMEGIARALRWAEIHSKQLELAELNAKLIKMSEELKSMLVEVSSYSNPHNA
jgi:hypothetical protein